VSAGVGVTLEIELVLLGPGGALAGTVVDPDGAPVADAWVLAGLDHALGVVERVPLGGTRSVSGVLAGPSLARTDAEGRYVVEGLAPGRRQVAVRAVGFGARRAEVEIVADVTQVHDVRLAPGVTVVGRITQADGTPATRASVEVGGYDVLRSEAHVDRDVRYRLEGLEAGELVLVVSSVYQGDRRVTVHGEPGETVVCDIVLVPGGSICGRVLDERGAPLAGWQLYTQDEPSVAEDHDSAGAETDAEGRFELRDLHDRTHRVFVRHPEHLRFPALEVSGVRPGDDELVLTVADAQWPSVFVQGRVVDVLGAPLSTARIAIGRDLAGRMHGISVDAQGEFHIGPLPSGTWCLRVHSGALGSAQVVLGPRTLAPDETWDCGDVVVRSDEH
jgi:hypothetical protein